MAIESGRASARLAGSGLGPFMVSAKRGERARELRPSIVLATAAIGNPSTFSGVVVIDDGGGVRRAAEHGRGARGQLGEGGRIPPPDLGFDRAGQLGTDQGDAAAAEPGAAEPGAE